MTSAVRGTARIDISRTLSAEEIARPPRDSVNKQKPERKRNRTQVAGDRKRAGEKEKQRREKREETEATFRKGE